MGHLEVFLMTPGGKDKLTQTSIQFLILESDCPSCRPFWWPCGHTSGRESEQSTAEVSN